MLPAARAAAIAAAVKRRPHGNAPPLGAVRAQYPDAEGFQRLIAADNLLTRSTAQSAAIQRSGPEPLSYVHATFERGLLDASAVAAELGVPISQLRKQLGSLDARWQTLAEPGGFIDRQLLSSQYASALCTVHSVARNRPARCP